MRNPFGYKVLRTYQQGEEIYTLTKHFTADHLRPIDDKRLIGHMNDSGRSIPRNIAEGYGRNNTKQYYEFLGFAFGSLIELIEDCLTLEKEIQEGRRMTKDSKGKQREAEKMLRDIQRIIKLCMGEKTMLKNQMERIEKMVGEQGLVSANQLAARGLAERREKEKELDRWAESLRHP